MLQLPSRITELIRRIEAGDTVTQADVRRIVELQLLDAAKLGEDFVREAIQRDRDQIKVLENG